MVVIEKGKEPDSWTQHRKTPGSEYESTPELRDSLLKDQGFICAYCMRRIPVTDHGTTESSRIEHIIPQSMLTREQAMEYSNMVICCPGAISSISEKLTHCDRHKVRSLFLSLLWIKTLSPLSTIKETVRYSVLTKDSILKSIRFLILISNSLKRIVNQFVMG